MSKLEDRIVLEPGRYGMYVEGVLFREGKYTQAQVDSMIAEAKADG